MGCDAGGYQRTNSTGQYGEELVYFIENPGGFPVAHFQLEFRIGLPIFWANVPERQES